MDRHAAGRRDIAGAIAVLKQRFGERLQTGQALRAQHASTLTWIAAEPPDAVLFPETTGEVQDAVRVAGQYRCPVIAFGAGTSLEGHVNAPAGGVCLDLARMNRLIAVHSEDLDAHVEAGMSRRSLNEQLRDTGLFFPIDPGAEDATLGGMAATRASGTNAVRYGTMRENVLNVTAVMADGEIVKTGQRARKSASGYDLTRLLVGSEGTLGIITELTVRLYGVPEAVLAAVCPFVSIGGACETVIEAIQLGLGLARIELVDEVQIRACNTYSKLALAEKPALFVEFHGSEAGVKEQVETFREIAGRHGVLQFQSARDEAERRTLWKARHDALWAVRAVWAGKDVLATDVCVPISRLAQCIEETQADLAQAGIVAPIVGHVGDGNFHAMPVFDKHDAAARANVAAFLERLAARALAMDGTISGEHGVGQGKRKYLVAEHGRGTAVMAQIKAALDPADILNPGKLLP